MKNLDLVILAGGLGSRISKITKNKPKPLIKFGKLNFLKNLINQLARFNFNRIYIIAGYKGEYIKQKFNNKKINLTEIKCIVEKKPKGTGGALYELKKYNLKNFILTNGDSICPIDLNRFTKNINNKLVKIALVENIYYKSNKTLSTLNIRNKKIYYDPKSDYMNAGIYYINKKFLKYITKDKKSFENHYLKDLILKQKVYGQKFNEKLFDIGTYENLRIANKILPSLFKKPAIFLDRDGVINYDYGYVHSKSKFKLKKNVLRGLKYLNKLDYYIFIITNQSGIARGYYTEKKFINFQKNVNEDFFKKNIYFHNVLYCPHHVEGKIKKYSIDCSCRKPKTLMLENINKNYDIDLKKSFFIGDKKTDQECAEKYKIKFYYAKDDFYSQLYNILNKTNNF